MTAGSGCDAVTAAVDRAFSEGLLPSAGPIVVGVSGGQDSLALIHALRQRVPEGAHLHAVHVNHCLRPESETDSRAVQRAVRAMGVSIDVRQYDVGLWAERRGLNLEAAARSVRYRLLASTAATMGTAQIVTGHTGGDQVETILMHLLRGAGPDGLVGLLPRQSIPLAAFGPPPPRIREGDPTLQNGCLTEPTLGGTSKFAGFSLVAAAESKVDWTLVLNEFDWGPEMEFSASEAVGYLWWTPDLDGSLKRTKTGYVFDAYLSDGDVTVRARGTVTCR